MFRKLREVVEKPGLLTDRVLLDKRSKHIIDRLETAVLANKASTAACWLIKEDQLNWITKNMGMLSEILQAIRSIIDNYESFDEISNRLINDYKNQDTPVFTTGTKSKYHLVKSQLKASLDRAEIVIAKSNQFLRDWTDNLTDIKERT